MISSQRAIIELVFAGALWGFGFIATVWGLRTLSPAGILVLRFGLAFLAGEIVRIAFFAKKSNPHFEKPSHKQSVREIKIALGAGLILGGLLIFQTIGLLYTTATKSGFITTLYVVETPLLALLIFKRPVQWFTWIAVAIAVAGTLFLTGVHLDELNRGDGLTLVCSVFAAFHILFIGKYTHQVKDSFKFNNWQSCSCFFLTLPLLYWQGFTSPHSSVAWHTDFYTWAGVLSLALLSSLVGFLLQIRSQKILTETTAALLFLLESPFAAVFAFILLQERLKGFQLLGCTLIIFAAAFQVFSANRRPNARPN